MNKDYRSRIESIFQEVADAPAPKREALLQRLCAGDAALRTEVEALLRHFDAGTAGVLRGALGPVEQMEQLGDVIGRYRLESILGEGGFGTVYLAEQTEPIRRRVALKVIKVGMDTRQVVARFEVERQTLAILDHPNLARVLDAGATARGRPYFVMDYVEGEPITKFCDDRRLSVDERLKLFLQVCDGVQHAHQKGIIHRDIKPSNVLVEPAGTSGRARVIDFGIAKAIGSESDANAITLGTRQAIMVGTPAYMSPEQAGIGDAGVDTRADVYSLGVLLYELLTGGTPLSAKKLSSAGLAEVQQFLRDIEPARPSTVVLSSDAATSHARSTEPAALARRIRGDLDWICLKAMERDRSRRYGTVAELAADVRRHLAHEPVLAGPPSAAYRARKFIRRHRVGVIATTASLAAGFGGLSIGLVRALDAENVARRAAERESLARKQAELAASEATLVRDFLANDILSSIRPEQARGRSVTMEEVLENAATRIDGKFPDQPGLEAYIRDVIGGTYRRLGKLPEAENHLRRAYELQQIAAKPGEKSRATAANNLAIVLRQQRRNQEAEPLYREALAICRDLGPDSEPDIATLLTNLVTMLSEQGRYEEAEPLAKESLDLHRKLFGEEDPRTAMVLNRCGMLLVRQERFDEGTSMMEKSLQIMQKVHGDKHPSTLVCLIDLGASLVAADRAGDGLARLESALPVAQEIMGKDHPFSWSIRTKIGDAQRLLGRLQEAEATLSALLADIEGRPGLDAGTLIATHRQLALTLKELGRHAEAANHFVRTYELMEQTGPVAGLDPAEIAAEVAAQLEAAGEIAKAEEWRNKNLPSPR